MPELPEVPGLKPGKNTLPDPAHEVNPPIPETPAAPPDVKVSDWRLTPTLTEKRLISTPIVGRSTKPAPLAKPSDDRLNIAPVLNATNGLAFLSRKLYFTSANTGIICALPPSEETAPNTSPVTPPRYRPLPKQYPWDVIADATADPLFSTTPASTDGWYPMS